MDQCKSKTDGDRSKAFWRFTVGRTEYDDQEKERHYDLGNEARHRFVMTRRMVAESVRCKPGTKGKTGFTACDDIQYAGGADR